MSLYRHSYATQEQHDNFATSMAVMLGGVLGAQELEITFELARKGMFAPREPGTAYSPFSHMAGFLFERKDDLPEHFKAWGELWHVHYKLCNPKG